MMESPDIPASACGASIRRVIERWSEDYRVIGIVDWSGTVHSRVARCGEDHARHFGWRMNQCWDFDVIRQRLYCEDSVDVEELDAILRHLRRKGFIKPNDQGVGPATGAAHRNSEDS